MHLYCFCEGNVGLHDDFHHFSLSCKPLKQFWNNIGYLLNLNFRTKHDIKLKEIVVDYNINDINFDTVNLLITIVSFTVYKCRVINAFNPNAAFNYELLWRIKN